MGVSFLSSPVDFVQEPRIPGLRPMTVADVPEVHALFHTYMERYVLVAR